MRRSKGDKGRPAREATAEVAEGRELQNHPLADHFPLMPDAKYRRFKADIAENGQHEPIRVYQGKIVDGRHRYRACKELGREPIIEHLKGPLSEADLARRVWSFNAERRHLTKSQLAMIAVDMEAYLDAKAEAQQRMRAGGKIDADPSAKLREGERAKGKASDVIGAKSGISGRMVEYAMAVHASGVPHLVEHVKSGKLKVDGAAKFARFMKVPELVDKDSTAARHGFPEIFGMGATPEYKERCLADPKFVRDKTKELSAKRGKLLKRVEAVGERAAEQNFLFGEEEHRRQITDAEERLIKAVCPDPHEAKTVMMGLEDPIGGLVGTHILAVRKMATKRLKDLSEKYVEMLGDAWTLGAKKAAAKLHKELSDGGHINPGLADASARAVTEIASDTRLPFRRPEG
jgi:hypothetical protein